MNAPGPCVTCSRYVKVPRRGMCRRCHQADLGRRRADGPIDGYIKVPILDRLLPRIDTAAAGGCWMWTGQINNKGYGLVWAGASKRAAHVVVWEQLVGPVPEGLQLDHLCRVRRCVNPDHLEPVTASENQRRAAEARRAA